MKIMKAKILDATHLELSQPISADAGADIYIAIPDQDDEHQEWQEAARARFLEAYDDQDAIYDRL